MKSSQRCRPSRGKRTSKMTSAWSPSSVRGNNPGATPDDRHVNYLGGRYPALGAFFIASTPSSKVSNDVVLLDLRAPPAATAREKAAALTLSGMLQIATTSSSPNDNHAPSGVPPRFSIAERTTSVRFWGFFTKPAHASVV